MAIMLLKGMLKLSEFLRDACCVVSAPGKQAGLMTHLLTVLERKSEHNPYGSLQRLCEVWKAQSTRWTNRKPTTWLIPHAQKREIIIGYAAELSWAFRSQSDNPYLRSFSSLQAGRR